MADKENFITKGQIKTLFMSGMKNVEQPTTQDVFLIYINVEGKTTFRKFKTKLTDIEHAEIQTINYLNENKYFHGDVIIVSNYSPCRSCTEQILQFAIGNTWINFKLMFSCVNKIRGGEFNQTYEEDLKRLMMEENIQVSNIGEWHWPKLLLWSGDEYKWWNTKPSTRDKYIIALVNQKVWKDLVNCNDWESSMKIALKESGMLETEHASVPFLTGWATQPNDKGKLVSKPIFSQVPISRNLLLADRTITDCDTARILSDIRRKYNIDEPKEEIDDSVLQFIENDSIKDGSQTLENKQEHDKEENLPIISRQSNNSVEVVDQASAGKQKEDKTENKHDNNGKTDINENNQEPTIKENDKVNDVKTESQPVKQNTPKTPSKVQVTKPVIEEETEEDDEDGEDTETEVESPQPKPVKKPPIKSQSTASVLESVDDDDDETEEDDEDDEDDDTETETESPPPKVVKKVKSPVKQTKQKGNPQNKKTVEEETEDDDEDDDDEEDDDEDEDEDDEDEDETETEVESPPPKPVKNKLPASNKPQKNSKK